MIPPISHQLVCVGVGAGVVGVGVVGAGVVGVGVGYRQRHGKFTDQVAIVVMVRQKQSTDAIDPADLLPTELEGIPVDVQQTGDLTID